MITVADVLRSEGHFALAWQMPGAAYPFSKMAVQTRHHAYTEPRAGLRDHVRV